MDLSTARTAAEFAKVANGFCAWCENPFEPANAEASAAFWLARLYAQALMLPHVEPDNSNDPPPLPVEATAKARQNLSIFNGCYYRTFFDSDPALDDEPVMGDLGDDLSDIYKDIKEGLALFEGGEIEDALWHWSFSHRAHWGRHAASALHALHCKAIAL